MFFDAHPVFERVNPLYLELDITANVIDSTGFFA